MLRLTTPCWFRMGLTILALLSADSSRRCNADQSPRLNVNDISILWPAPRTAEDVQALISADDLLADGVSPIWPTAAFQTLLETSRKVSVTASSGAVHQINEPGDQPAFASQANWKIAGIRIDPSAPGCSPQIIRLLGSRPQIRVIMQPVTQHGSSVVVHDVTAHLVFDFVERVEPPMAAGLPPRSIPDRTAFTSIVEELVLLKAAAGVSTDSTLGVHPALKSNPTEFTKKVQGFLAKYLHQDRLGAMAFMGLDSPEPWIFFAMNKQPNGSFARFVHPSLKPSGTQMFSRRGGNAVMPVPHNSTFGPGIGISTAVLFENAGDILQPATSQVLPTGVPQVLLQDVPDLIANPGIAHFGTTDCVSCHTESARRLDLGLATFESAFRYKLPAGIAGIDETLLPKSDWNVRNFGWFPLGRTVVETVTMRTANEAAESAEFINREYLRADQSSNADLEQPAASPPIAPETATPVTKALTLVMTIKSAEDRDQLKRLIDGMQALPPDRNPIVLALTKLGDVHFARFVFIGEDKLAVITTYDNEFEVYIRSFVAEIGDIFDQLLTHMKDAPTESVKVNPEAFLEYVKKNDLTCEQPLYSAYPKLKVQDILTLQKRAAEQP